MAGESVTQGYPTVNLASGAAVVASVSTGVADGHKEVTTAGTAVPLAASTVAKWVTIQAYRANTGYIAVGASTVLASLVVGTGRGISLAAGESVTLPVANLSSIYIDSTVSGEGVRYTYGT